MNIQTHEVQMISNRATLRHIIIKLSNVKDKKKKIIIIIATREKGEALPLLEGRLVGAEGELWGPREHSNQSCAGRQDRVRTTQMAHATDLLVPA